ncbi:MAG: hypothetical protein CL920_08295 [Deltaproteobacteria bacterium]|nr:hypothetical protein [Deltaproteobacteria bacterium]
MKQMTTAASSRAVERLEDVACDIRIAIRDCNLHSGALCEDTSATAPGSVFEFPPYLSLKLSPLPSPKAGEEWGRPKARGMERFIKGGGCNCPWIK